MSSTSGASMRETVGLSCADDCEEVGRMPAEYIQSRMPLRHLTQVMQRVEAGLDDAATAMTRSLGSPKLRCPREALTQDRDPAGSVCDACCRVDDMHLRTA